MRLEKTTVMSAIIWVAGMLAEIIFHDALSKSIFGIVLGIIIAIIVIMATYFTLDGINAVLSGSGNEALGKRLEQQEKMLSVLGSRLDEQIKSGQAVYEKLDDIIKINRSYMEKAAGEMFAVQDEGQTSAEDGDMLTLKKAMEEINAHTLQSAKIIVKYQMKNSAELKDSLDLILDKMS
ncbi:MAG TPA: hypothetical protein DCZ23_07900 [Lachnospiraceae bacterium]|nr:hypothetical protein [Lachnospiraceae bacterium]